MNVVVYTEDFEPITVLDLPLWLLEQMEKQGAVRVAVMQPPKLMPATDSMADYEPPQTVTIYCEKLRWKDGSTKPILITYDEELAMSLRPDWLPGQRGAINSYKQVIRSLTDNLVKAMRK
jgi:hypothetical protein